MSKKQQVHTAEQVFEEWLETGRWEPWFEESQIRALVLFNERMLNVADDQGFTYRGFSWRPGVPYGLLVVRITKDDKPLVCFLNARTLLDTFVLFARKLSGKTIVWKADRFG